MRKSPIQQHISQIILSKCSEFMIALYEFITLLQHKTNSMTQLQKKQVKTVEEYRHNIKLLKYYLKKQTKTNETLKYQLTKKTNKKSATEQHSNKKTSNSLKDTVKLISNSLKLMGLTFGDIFRMADTNYQGQITKEQFTKVVEKIKMTEQQINQNQINQVFYAIDTSLNNMLEQDEFQQFIIAFGGGDAKQARKYQTKALVKLSAMLKKNYKGVDKFLSGMKDPIEEQQLVGEMKKMGLNGNEINLLLKVLDPQNVGEIRHEVVVRQLEAVGDITERDIKNKQKEKDIQELCVKFRERKLNPIILFEEADVDHEGGVTPLELENSFKSLFPEETNFQIKKWVALINIDNDQQVTREEFMNAIRSFYTLEQLTKFSNQSSLTHKDNPNFKKEEVAIEKVIADLNNKIEDKGYSRKQFFNLININHDQSITKEEMAEGLKHLGMDVVFVAKVMNVFDSDNNHQITMNQWLHVLGEDVQMSDVQMPQDTPQKKQKQNTNNKKKQTKNENKKQTKKQPIKKEDPKKKVDPKRQSTQKSTKKEQISKNQSLNKTQQINKKQSVIKKQTKKEDKSKPPANQKINQSKASSPEKQKRQSKKQEANKNNKKQQPVKISKKQQPVKPIKNMKQTNKKIDNKTNEDTKFFLISKIQSKIFDEDQKNKQQVEDKHQQQEQEYPDQFQNNKAEKEAKKSEANKNNKKQQPVKISKKQQPVKPIKNMKQTNKKIDNKTNEDTKFSLISKIQSKIFDEDQKNKQQVEDKHQQEQEYPDQFQNNKAEKEANEVQFQQVQKDIGIKYKKNKNNILNEFQKYDKKKLGYVSQKAFKELIPKITKNPSEQQINALFQKLCESGGIVKYKEWLDQISDQYAEDIQQEKEKQKEPQIKNPKKPQIKKKSTKIQKQQEQEVNYDNQDQQIQQQQQKDKHQQNNTHSLMKNIINKTVQGVKSKRGDNLKQFSQLLVLKIGQDKQNSQKNKKQGYKLSDYIDSKQQIELLNQKYLPRAKNLKKNKKLFIDQQFPDSIASFTKAPSKSKIQNVTMLKWKHYKDIFKNPQLFDKGVNPNDILQGSLGDCYFLCSLSCLAQYTNMIERLFEYSDMECGYFLIWLCIDGEWKIIELDGMVPTDPTGRQLAFSRTNSQELWVVLLEKAYAKAYGDYDKIIGGQAYQAIKDLSGGPGKSFMHKDKKQDQIWNSLMEANQKQFLMTCGTQMKQQKVKHIQGHQQAITNEGIVLGHAYSILDVQQVKGERIVELRNPWGKIEWKGDWSDTSKKWTPELKKKLNYTCNENDGTFWMPFPNFYKEYNCTAINYIRPSYYYGSLKQSSIKSVVAKVEAGSFQHGFFMVGQKDHRHQGLPVNTPYNLLHLISFTVVNGKVARKISDNKYLYQRQGCAQFDSLKPNEQALVMISLQNSSDVNLAYYSNKKIEFDIDNDCLPYMQGIASLQVNSERAMEQPNMLRYWLTSVGQVAFMCFKNISDQKYTLALSLTTLNNLKLLPPHNTKSKLNMKPDQIKSIKARILNIKQGFSFGQFSLNFEK